MPVGPWFYVGLGGVVIGGLAVGTYHLIVKE